MILRAPHPGETYVHFKGGQYRVLAVGIDSETLGAVVAYQKLHNGLLVGHIWFRPLESWLKPVPASGSIWDRLKGLVMPLSATARARFSLVGQ